MELSRHKIRPAARLLRTVGQDLVKDVYAAIVELVKNSYDADSSNVIIKLSYDEDNRKLAVSIIDHGDGMSADTVINTWLVPATSDKLIRKKSKKNRALQGRKGIGRFAAAVLGATIRLETVKDGRLTKLVLDMNHVENLEFLDQLELDVYQEECSRTNGTFISIETSDITSKEVKDIWTPKQIRKLLIELRSLTAPQEVYEAAAKQGFSIENDKFDIELRFENFPLEEYSNRSIVIEPFPLLDLYDYRVFGVVSDSGDASLVFENQNVRALVPEKIYLNIPIDKVAGQMYPGEIYIDFRAYDRDPDAIVNIINRGLKDPETGHYLGKMEAKKILDEYYGVGIYREQFKIRPYGDPSIDWLDLDKQRVQNPSTKIGHNQLVGFINVRHEESSYLVEKSARDGLVENGAYFGLITIVSSILKQLESRRYNYRQHAQKGRRSNTINEELDLLFDFDQTKKQITSFLKTLDTPSDNLGSVVASIDQLLDKEQQKKAELERKIRETIAIYQGQATLGKITHVLLHEGRKHIKYISETVPRIAKWATSITEGADKDIVEKLQARSKTVITHTKGLSFLFKKIEPLARTRRSPNKPLNLFNELHGIGAIFEAEFLSYNILFSIVNSAGDDLTLTLNEVDLITVFSNLIENSIFWLSQSEKSFKKISISIYIERDSVFVEFSDNGPGFQGDNLELMFEPGYSMKPNGTGLGLSLAGEAMSRIGGTIEAKNASLGAMFEVSFKDK
jgi:anti-sigma regulatory factor (Ser/Thr protein kinase)